AGRREAGNFVRWARHQKLTGLDLAAVRWDGPTGLIDTEARWQQARRVLLDAQRAATLSRLTLEHVQTCEQQVRIRLGREPVLLPEPLAALILVLVSTRHGHAALGDQ